MARVRKIQRKPNGKRNYYLVDSSFLANNYIPINCAPDGHQRKRIRLCKKWWEEIDKQLKRKRARVYVPDICIAEAFKVLAKKYYEEKWFNKWQYNKAKQILTKNIQIPTKILKAQQRDVQFHDISTSRDIIIAVDRFYELFMKNKKSVSLPDLIIVATAKYLMDFFDIDRQLLHIVTLDENLWSGIKKVTELPNAYNPTIVADSHSNIFE
jgi:hypothetical protein